MEFGYGDCLGILLNLITKESGKPYNLFEISQSVGISKSSIYKLYHNETQNPSYTILKKIAGFFDIHTDYFSCKSSEECIQYIAQCKQGDHDYFRQISTRVTQHDEDLREAIEELVMLLRMKSALSSMAQEATTVG